MTVGRGGSNHTVDLQRQDDHAGARSSTLHMVVGGREVQLGRTLGRDVVGAVLLRIKAVERGDGRMDPWEGPWGMIGSIQRGKK